METFRASDLSDQPLLPEPCLCETFIGFQTGKANPHIDPWLLPVCLIAALPVGRDQKRVVFPQMKGLALNLQSALPPQNNMDQVNGTFRRTVEITRPALLNAAVVQRQFYGILAFICLLYTSLLSYLSSSRISFFLIYQKPGFPKMLYIIFFLIFSLNLWYLYQYPVILYPDSF